MFKLNSKFTIIIFAICFFVLNKKAYSANKAIGDIRAVVLQEIVRVNGESVIYQLQRQGNSTADRGKGYFYEGNIIYDMQSEPNSLITVYYQAGNNSSSLIKPEESLTSITKVDFEYDSRLLNFDKNGNSELRVKPVFFISNNSSETDYRAIYYITLLY